RWTRNAARLLLCKLACTSSRLGGVLLCKGPGCIPGEPCLSTGPSATCPGVMMPVHRLICFCRYFRWLTFLLDFTGLSRASLMLLEAESMKLSRSLVVSLKSSSFSASHRRLPSRLFSTSYSITDAFKPKVHSQASGNFCPGLTTIMGCL
uniref:Secreted protein n=1 Tax=Nothobranchius furzeri TaxID=105023 RepID=A0A8C6L976_NOTFU